MIRYKNSIDLGGLHLNKRSCIVTNLIGIQRFTRESIVSCHEMVREMTKDTRIEGTSVIVYAAIGESAKLEDAILYFFVRSHRLSSKSFSSSSRVISLNTFTLHYSSFNLLSKSPRALSSRFRDTSSDHIPGYSTGSP